MPLFEFTCRKCDHQFEELITTAELEDGELKCPACRSKRVEKDFSGFATSTAGAASSGSAGKCASTGFT